MVFINFYMDTIMLRKIIMGTTLAASCVYASATTTADRWDFSWQGFQVEYGSFNSSRTVSGRFGGVDLNHDNKIELSELNELVIDGRDFLTCGVIDYSHRCSLSAFSYVLGGKLSFTAERNDSWDYGDWADSTGAKYFADSYVERQYFSPYVGLVWNEFFTSRTTFTITAVPEPQTYAMLAAGLALLIGAGKWKRRRELCVE
jgi:hypothetical protein